MIVAQAINAGIRFILELCLLAAVGYWGLQLDGSWPIRSLAAIGAPLLVAGLWGLFVAPKAWRRLPEPWRFGLEVTLFALGAVALYEATRPSLAAILAIAFLVNRVLVSIWQQQV